MPPDIAQRLDRIRTNNIAGAVDLALEAIDIALAAPHARDELARELRSMHAAIVTVGNVGRFLEKNPSDVDLNALRRSLVEGTSQIAARAAQVIPRGASVITLSNSSTVEAALRQVQPGRIFVLESLPAGEGRTLASRLGADVVADAEMGRVAAEIDCALVGIDAYDRSGAILHKAGTLPLALCCAHFGKPFYAAGHSFKLAPTDTRDILKTAGPAATHFDRTPPELITAIITEQGL